MATRDTEAVILESARKVFVELGPVRARMQDIAEEADITQSLLHYYFRKRDDLYRAVFEEELKRFVPEQVDVLMSDRPLLEKLETFARGVIDFHAENLHLAAFVAFETHYNEEHRKRLEDTFADLDLSVMQQQIDARVEAGEMAPIDARHLLTNLLSMCLLPFVTAPIFRTMYGMDEDAYHDFLDERKDEVPAFVERALTTDVAS
jgi:AcrR family transcriptional regulator